ncbi:MAG: hypothetical protein IKM46_05130 [Clostridia bacterium]|nr:hypothetical protein [Clostridia bacterium]
MNTFIAASALFVSALIKPDAALGLLFGLSVSISALFCRICVGLSEKYVERKALLFGTVVFSICISAAFSRSVGSIFSGEADSFFYGVTSAGSAIISFFACSKEGISAAEVLKNVLPVIPLSFGVSILRELFGEGSIFGRELELMHEFKINSLSGHLGALLLISGVVGITVIVRERLGGEDGT